jgi:acetyl esterase
MPLDPKLKQLLEMPGMQLGVPPPDVTPTMMREATRAQTPPVVPPAIHATKDLHIQGPAGAIRVRLYTPSPASNLPLVVFFHGGGFVLCDLDSHDVMCRMLANSSGCAVAAVDYRLAPETPFPGPLEDCYAALLALYARATELGCDGDRLAVAGDSAGGNLAAAVCLLARARRGPPIRYQALFCPCLDARCDSASMRDLAEGYLLSSALMKWFWRCYAPDTRQQADELVSPVLAGDLTGLPPASISTAEFDPLRDEGEFYTDRLRAAGVPVMARRYNGMIHDFMQMPLATEHAVNAIADVAQDLRAALQPIAPDTLAIVKKLYELSFAGSWAAIRELTTDDFAVHEASDLPFGGTYRGADAMPNLMAKVGGLLTIKDLHFRNLMHNGEDVVAILDLVVAGPAGDETIPIMERFRFRGDRVCELRPFYFDTAQVHRVSNKDR